MTNDISIYAGASINEISQTALGFRKGNLGNYVHLSKALLNEQTYKKFMYSYGQFLTNGTFTLPTGDNVTFSVDNTIDNNQVKLLSK